MRTEDVLLQVSDRLKEVGFDYKTLFDEYPPQVTVFSNEYEVINYAMRVENSKVVIYVVVHCEDDIWRPIPNNTPEGCLGFYKDSLRDQLTQMGFVHIWSEYLEVKEVVDDFNSTQPISDKEKSLCEWLGL